MNSMLASWMVDRLATAIKLIEEYKDLARMLDEGVSTDSLDDAADIITEVGLKLDQMTAGSHQKEEQLPALTGDYKPWENMISDQEKAAQIEDETNHG